MKPTQLRKNRPIYDEMLDPKLQELLFDALQVLKKDKYKDFDDIKGVIEKLEKTLIKNKKNENRSPKKNR